MSIHAVERVQTSEMETNHSVDLRIGISTSADLRTRTGSVLLPCFVFEIPTDLRQIT